MTNLIRDYLVTDTTKTTDDVFELKKKSKSENPQPEPQNVTHYDIVERDFFNLKIVRTKNKSVQTLELHADPVYFHIKNKTHDHDMIDKCNRRVFSSFMHDMDEETRAGLTRNNWYGQGMFGGQELESLCESMDRPENMRWINAGCSMRDIHWMYDDVTVLYPCVKAFTHKAALAYAEQEMPYSHISVDTIRNLLLLNRYIDDIQVLLDIVEKDGFKGLDEIKNTKNDTSILRSDSTEIRKLNVQEWMRYIERTSRGQALEQDGDGWLRKNGRTIQLWLDVMMDQDKALSRIEEPYPTNLHSTHDRFEAIAQNTVLENDITKSPKSYGKSVKSSRFSVKFPDNPIELLMRMHVSECAGYPMKLIVLFKDRKNAKDDTLATIEEYGKKVIDIAGFEGRRPDPEIMEYIRKWCDLNGVEIPQ